MKDFLGNEYGPGDLVIYGASSGRCINMVIGRVVKIAQRESRDYVKLEDGKWGYVRTPVQDKDGNPVYSVRVQPLRSSRWAQHSPGIYYVDTRTGQKVDRYQHVKQHPYYTLNSTGQRLPSGTSEYYKYVKTRRAGCTEDDFRMVPEKNPDYVPPEKCTYHETVFEDYIEVRREDVKPVTITVTENIVKWDGELPGE